MAEIFWTSMSSARHRNPLVRKAPRTLTPMFPTPTTARSNDRTGANLGALVRFRLVRPVPRHRPGEPIAQRGGGSPAERPLHARRIQHLDHLPVGLGGVPLD